MTMHDVLIVGAGPYGLAATTHLRAAGVDARPFGRPMAFWRNRMPTGMLLRSSYEASHIADPHRVLTLDAYGAAERSPVPAPVPIERFVAYGHWYAQQAVPDLDPRSVARIVPREECFVATLEDGETVRARRVVVAAGIERFANRPSEFRGLPPELASHSSEQVDLRRFAGQRIVVVGAGQSALESAALLSESGAEVEMIGRAPRVRWLTGGARFRGRLGPLAPVVYPSTDVGPPVLNQIVAHPGIFQRLPRALQDRIAYRCIRPAGATWLPGRMGGVRITPGRRVTRAVPVGRELTIELDDGTTRRVDHALLATGYRIEVDRYDFLVPELLRAIARDADDHGYPRLGVGLESSVRRLHLLGAPGARSFGPLMRFVSGAGYAARALTRTVVGQREVAWPAVLTPSRPSAAA